MSPGTYYTITFPPEKRPATAALEREVQAISGLAVQYAPEKMSLFCPALKRQLFVFEDENNTYCIFNRNKEADYLLVTTIVALKKLGGTFDASLPPWAGQAWKHLNKWAYRLRRNRIRYPRIGCP